MKQLEVYQVSYGRGIIENVRQDSLVRNNAMDSVLYLQNFNPNLETQSLVIRPGENIYSDIPTLDIGAYTHLPFVHDLQDIVQHIYKIQTSNPTTNDTILVFIKRYPEGSIETNLNDDFCIHDSDITRNINSTAIIALVPKTDGTGVEWQEPYRDQRVYKGWYPFGELKDATRYSESILFTTKLEDIDAIIDGKRLEKLYPVYVWQYWNLTRKRKDNNQYFNGLTFSPDLDDKDTYTGWRIKSPTMLLKRKTMAGGYQVKNVLGYHLYDISNDTEVTNFAPISLVFWEQDLYRNGHFENMYGETKWDNVGSIVTIESLNEPDFTDMYLGTLQGRYSTSHHLSGGSCCDDIDSSVWDILGGHIKTTAFNAKYYFRKRINKMFHLIEFGTGSVTSDKSKYLGNRKLTLTFMLPDYLNADLPRPFIRGEKIPFVLTGMVNGVETILLEDVYKPCNANYPSEYLDNFNDASKLNHFAHWDSNGTEIYSDVSTNIDKDILDPSHVQNETKAKGASTTVAPFCIGDWKVVHFTIRLSEEGRNFIIDNNITSLKLYVSKPSEKDSLLRSVGHSIVPVDPPVITYAKPYIGAYVLENDLVDYMGYKLVKEFKIDGRGTIIDSYRNFNGRNGSSTNAWLEATDSLTSTRGYWAVPQKPGTNDVMRINNGVQNFNFWNLDSGSSDPEDKMWTPDFMLWDYPNETDPLLLGGSGDLWEGIGARCIASIKGRTFIGGTIDKEGTEEQAKVRYSVVQGGVISQDLFYKEDWIKFGHAPITALLEFREQLVVFNANSWYRMLLHSITDPTSWEMLEAVEGSGTYSPKTVINTPVGFVYLHESGIYISEGNIPRNIVNDPRKGHSILALYQTIMTGSTYLYNDLVFIGEFPIEDGYNKWAELLYDANNVEIILKTPVRTTTSADGSSPEIEDCNGELRLIFNIEHQNWRTEYYDREGYDRNAAPVAANPLLYTWSRIGKLTSTYIKIFTARCQELTNNIRMTFGIPDISKYADVLEVEEHTQGGTIMKVYENKIIGKIVTHEIGNSQDDCLLHSTVISLVSTSKDVKDEPVFGYELRNREWYSQNYLEDSEHDQDTEGFVDLIAMNRQAKGADSIFESNAMTPEGIDTVEEYSGNGDIPVRESIVLNTPRGTQFRRMRFKWLSTAVAKLKTIRIAYIMRKRRRM